ncbi:hypothetical protein B0H11DRAFT_2070391 [Mycena galericulata]|nr:hypothetical protein B0H11DRAFT_2070391 [Mycena galericulata]
MTGAHESRTDDEKPIVGPVLKGTEFYKDLCRKYEFSDEIKQLLENEKFETAEALLDAVESSLGKAGYTQDQIAEVKRALTEFFEDGGQNRRVSINGISKIIVVPTLNVAEFCKQYKLNDEIQQLLEKEKFETPEALSDAADSNLEKVGFKQEQIADMKRALAEFAKDGGQSS